MLALGKTTQPRLVVFPDVTGAGRRHDGGEDGAPRPGGPLVNRRRTASMQEGCFPSRGRRVSSLARAHLGMLHLVGRAGSTELHEQPCGNKRGKAQHNMRKTVITVALAAGVLATAAACGGSSSSSGPGGQTHSVSQTEQQNAIGAKLDLSKLSPSIKDPSSPVTITYETWQDFSKGTLPALAKEFHQIHPNITVKFQSVPADSAQTKLTTQI